MAHIRESRVLATHLIHTKTQQVLHLLLESAASEPMPKGFYFIPRLGYNLRRNNQTLVQIRRFTVAQKYYCPKCGRKFIEWGAQKLDFKCPGKECDGEHLKLIDPKTLEAVEKPKTKKPRKKKERVVPVSSDFDLEDGVSEVPLEDEEYEEPEEISEEEIEEDYLEEDEEEIPDKSDLILAETEDDLDPLEIVDPEDEPLEDVVDDDIPLDDQDEDK